MASLNMFLAPAVATISATTTTTTTSRTRRVQTFATAAKGSSGGSSEEKGFFDWIVSGMEKDQLVETDPVLQKVEGKSGTVTTSGKKTTAGTAPPKKSGGTGGFGGLGGLFAKK